MVGYRENLDRLTARITQTTGIFLDAAESMTELEKEAKRKQKAIDRIAWKAESKQ